MPRAKIAEFADVVAQVMSSWNQIMDWLSGVNLLRKSIQAEVQRSISC